MRIGVQEPLDTGKWLGGGELEGVRQLGWVRALGVDRTARNHGRRSLTI
jgi:hypothetical protein